MNLFKTIIVLVTLSFILVITAACGRTEDSTAAKPYKETQFLMDTVVEITAYGPGAEAAVKDAFAEFKRIHDLTNRFDETSQVSKINQAAGKGKIAADPDVVAMIKHSNEIADKFDRTFDITVGPLVDLWGIGRKGDFIPTKAEIEKVLPLVNYKLVVVDDRAGTIYLPKEGMALDLGGIAKGYAVDKVIDILKAHGVKSALVNAGGDVRVIGKRPDGKSWRIGVQHPRNQEAVIAKLSLDDWDTMETSGDYQRFFEKDGVRYSHILDPRTGYQPRQLASVTMVINNSTDGDVLSTALFILGPERGLELLKQFPGVEAIMVTNEGTIIVSPGLQGKLELGQ